ncbi:2OG-Fe(II) oxygenase superfamily protein [Hyaloscypha bicolor E]|uniref:2OG-Fe(II) oxygenase superfamily protein n=1 Tax=Hyaloscypha bicolor E TaxID=1095630 RepID=A0A2J6SH40_9HELO|nr:2OG-Fe(II) oxygenase superfamily protein [Hyaloscypha bicolor E]PMD50074.1 2OG-Fe(II) oxygenase superfamily protein [Hyaloscypha bicolor E]
MATTTATEEAYVLKVDSFFGPVSRNVNRAAARDPRPGEISVIDVSRIFSDKLSDRQAVADKVRKACKDIGFFYVTNHGIPDSVAKAAVDSTLEFFRQPLEIKQEVHFDHEIEGYTGRNNEQINKTEPIDTYEKFKLQYRPSMDPTSKLPGYPTGGVYQEFPWEKTATVPSFQPAMIDSFTSRLLLGRRLLRICALALDLPETYFDEMVAQPFAGLALNYFPTPKNIPTGTDGEESIEHVGLGSHTDFGLITLLWQDHPGLQVLSPGGDWIKVNPIPDTLICNLGDLMALITNGRFISDVHRARNVSKDERVSMPFFLGVGGKVKIEIVPTCVDPEAEKAPWEGMLAVDWTRKRQAACKVENTGKGAFQV